MKILSQKNICIGSLFIPFLFAITQFSNQQIYFIYFLGYALVSYIASHLTILCIPAFSELMIKANLFGLDINKKGTPAGQKKIPESLGLVPATIFILFNMIGVYFSKFYLKEKVFEHTASLLQICFVVLLGFADDVLNLRWRYKIWLPAVASLPILVAYNGSTSIVLPKILHGCLGSSLDLGIFFFIYMGMLGIFCTNSINIYAGINGLEVGQSIIIAISILLYNIIQFTREEDLDIIQSNILSFCIMIPYIFCTIGLFKYNKYPSQVFVGDTFCYWSGMTFAVVAILGHFSKTLLLFFIPQIINFLYSVPQLISFIPKTINKIYPCPTLMKIIPCPRHRLPYYNQTTGKLEAIKTNCNLLNLFLWIIGPTSEEDTCTYLIILQIVCCAFGFFLRFCLPRFIF